MSPGPRNPKFDDGESARSDFRDSGRQISDRKMAQLCQQIRRAIEMAMLGTVEDTMFEQLEVESVEPGADPGRIHVNFIFHGDADHHDRNTVLQRIEMARNVLTAEVAQAITRKKVPDLLFDVRSARAGGDSNA